MDVSLYQAFQGLKAQSNRLDSVSNNISNVNTSGYKADAPFFELVRQSLKDSPGDSSSFIRPKAYIDFSQGNLCQSENTLDLALEGKGFFCLKTSTGLAYTRNGSFKIDQDGFMTNSEGFRVQGVDGDIKLQQGKITIDSMGNISSNGYSNGVLRICDFSDYSGLEKTGNSLFVPLGPQVKETVPAEWSVKQGFNENSNVDPSGSMVELMTIMRRFEMLQKAMNSVINEIDKKSIEQVGKSRG